MKKLIDLLNEVAQPISGDERKFKSIHQFNLLNYPVDVEFQQKGIAKGRSAKRPPDNDDENEKDDIDKSVVRSANFNLNKGVPEQPPNLYAKLYKALEMKSKIIDENIKPVIPAGGEFDCEKTHIKYKKSNKSNKLESIFILDDGSEQLIETTDFEKLEKLFNNLNEDNRALMLDIASKDADGLDEMISFADKFIK